MSQTIKRVVPLILKSCSLGLVIAAGGLWSCSGVDPRQIYKDQQALVGGTIWSQILIPLGLIISKIVEDNLDNFVNGYFLLSGTIVLSITGAVLIIGEYKIIQRRKRAAQEETTTPTQEIIKEKDKVNVIISILVLIAAVFTFVEFLLLTIMS